MIVEKLRRSREGEIKNASAFFRGKFYIFWLFSSTIKLFSFFLLPTLAIQTHSHMHTSNDDDGTLNVCVHHPKVGEKCINSSSKTFSIFVHHVEFFANTFVNSRNGHWWSGDMVRERERVGGGWMAWNLWYVCFSVYINKKFTIVVGSSRVMPTICIAHTSVRFPIQSRWFSVVVNNTAAESKISFFHRRRERYKKINKKKSRSILVKIYIFHLFLCVQLFFCSLSHTLLVQQITTQASSVCSRSAFHTFTIFYLFLYFADIFLPLERARDWQNSQKFLSVTANCNFLSCKHTRGIARLLEFPLV